MLREASLQSLNKNEKRMKRFELSTLSLARRCSTTELHPQSRVERWVRYDLGSMQHKGAVGQCPGNAFIKEAISKASKP